MVHQDPKFDHKVNQSLDEWEDVKTEVETKIQLGRLEIEHLKLLDKVEEKFVSLQNRSSTFNGTIKSACDEAESLRSRVRRKLLKQATASEIPFSEILKES